jgi:hypothetical protein
VAGVTEWEAAKAVCIYIFLGLLLTVALGVLGGLVLFFIPL